MPTGPLTTRASNRILLIAASALVACSSGPMPELPQDPGAALDLAQQLMEPQPSHARYVLESLDTAALTPVESERYDALYAESLLRTGSAWSAFKVIRNFVEDHRFSDWTPQVEETHFRIGEQLMQSEATYFIFGSDRDDADIVLREFVQRFSTSVHVPDALRMLGEYAFEEERWADARRHFDELLRDFPTSEWVALASFRRVMSLHAELIGPEYDMPSMVRTRNELRDYLASEPERPEFRQQATAAFAQVQDWIARRHLIDADFYRTVGNRYGERYHLQLLVQDSPESPLVDEAEQRLRAMEEVR